MHALSWLLRLLVFFVLFAFALNNQHEVALKSFFGYEWRAPMVFIVLAAFVAGCATGVLGMLPSWWRQRRTAQLPGPRPTAGASPESAAVAPAPIADALPEHPPRDGL